MIESYLLEYFMAVYEEGTILKASEKLHVSQPSVTKAMQKLEYELDIHLFDRQPNKITLNSNGKILVEYIKDAISIDRRIKEKADELKREALTINIVMTAPGPTLKYPNFFYFERDKNPYKLEIKEEKDCIRDILSGIADIAFINSHIQLPNIHIEKAFEEKLYVSLPKKHFLSKKIKGVTFSELDGQSFLIIKELGIWNEVINKHLKNSKFFKQDQSEIQEIINASNIPSFATNISIKYRESHDRVFIPILDEDSEKIFYAICKKEKIILLSKIKNMI